MDVYDYSDHYYKPGVEERLFADDRRAALAVNEILRERDAETAALNGLYESLRESYAPAVLGEIDQEEIG